MNVLLICVHYNSPDALKRLLGSLPPRRDAPNLRVLVVDNSGNANVPHEQDGDARSVTVLESAVNLGYFGGAAWGLDQASDASHQSDWVLVTNADIEFAPGFFEELGRISERQTGAAVLAPSIESADLNLPENPYLEVRPSLFKLKCYRALFRYRMFYLLYERLSDLRKRIRAKPMRAADSGGERDIYAPHGACIIFSSHYFKLGGTLKYPGFLYGEESFVAELVRRCGMTVRFVPTLKVRHQHQVSTGNIASKQKIKYFRQAAEYALEQRLPACSDNLSTSPKTQEKRR